MNFTSAKSICEGIAVNPNLIVLYLQRNDFSDDQGDYFVEAIKKTTSLFGFWIDDNKFSLESTLKFGEAMKSNVSILRSIHSDRSANNTFCLPSILRNQELFLQGIQLSLLSWLVQQFESSTAKQYLVDVKQFYWEIWKFYDLPSLYDFRVPQFFPMG
jgi:hypothetical protein